MCTCVAAQSLSHVCLFVTPWSVARQAPLLMGCFQTRILEWVAPSSSRESSHPRDQTCESCICCIDRQILYSEPHGKPTHRAGSEILLEIAAI